MCFKKFSSSDKIEQYVSHKKHLHVLPEMLTMLPCSFFFVIWQDLWYPLEINGGPAFASIYLHFMWISQLLTVIVKLVTSNQKNFNFYKCKLKANNILLQQYTQNPTIYSK